MSSGNKKISRRDFLKITAALGSIAALSQVTQITDILSESRFFKEIINPRLSYPSREWEKLYRDMWQYDKVARSTHGVNCTGSCSWYVYVKDGIVVRELQALDYPEISPSIPNYEPRGCPRGASTSWYLYAPTRVKYPYIRKPLLELWRSAREKFDDPVDAWADIVEDPEKRSKYVKARGLGGWVRASWDEVLEIIASALVYTIKKYGPDRIFGFTPIPAMSPVSYASGARFIELIGGSMGSFYDWYADLPPASPQIWGEQTDVPESADWYNAAYIINFGTNIPLTRTPDAHFFVEVRYRGTKIVVVSPDFSEHVKFADVWIPIRAGTDGALALSMAHVILKEYYVDKKETFFIEYAKKYTDLPFLVILEKKGDIFKPGKFLRLSDLSEDSYADPRYRDENLKEWKFLIYDSRSNKVRLVNGSIGYRWDNSGRWNINLNDPVTGDEVDPLLSVSDVKDEVVTVEYPVFDNEFGKSSYVRRNIPAIKIKGVRGTIYITTVFDLLAGHLGIDRGFGGDYPRNYNDPKPYTPAWQEKITGVSKDLAIKIAREASDTSIKSKGRIMIFLGPGVNHWYHADLYYRSIIMLVKLLAAQGRNGGGWAHYVGQEKIRTLIGWATVAFALDWIKPPRHQNSPSFYYIHTDQWRYDTMDLKYISPKDADFSKIKCTHPADCNVIAARLGWLPFYPQFNRSTIELSKEARRNNKDPVEYIVEKLKDGTLKLAIEDPDAPENWIRVMFVWRANLLGSSSKGHEYFLKHLLGSPMASLDSDEKSKNMVKEIVWRDPAPEGKLDLLVYIDFRMPTTAVYSDIVLPAATWYEKYDLSMTDLHTFIHPFTPAVDPLWESKTDWEIFKELARKFSEIAKKHFPEPVEDVVARALWHDTPMEIAQPYGVVKDWRKGETDPIPGKTMWHLKTVTRDYSNVYNMFISLGPGARKVGAKGISYSTDDVYEELKIALGSIYWDKCPEGCPSIEKDKNAAEVILALSPEANGILTKRAFESLEKKTGVKLSDLAKNIEAIKFDNIIRQPRRVHSSPVWSGIEDRNRTYAPFTLNTERNVPWRTLTGRQHFYVDHDWFLELGEFFAIYKPPLDMVKLGYIANTVKMLGINVSNGNYRLSNGDKRYLALRFLTPHGKWNIHSEFWDNLIMLTLFRGGQVVWINDEDAKWAGINDNDWIEVVNDNGTIVARVATSPRIPPGIAIMYHAQERHVYMRKSKIRGKKGGVHNSVTRVDLKPTKMVGGYGQLSYFFNYYGPTGVNRDTIVIVFLHEKMGSRIG